MEIEKHKTSQDFATWLAQSDATCSEIMEAIKRVFGSEGAEEIAERACVEAAGFSFGDYADLKTARSVYKRSQATGALAPATTGEIAETLAYMRGESDGTGLYDAQEFWVLTDEEAARLAGLPADDRERQRTPGMVIQAAREIAGVEG